MEDMPQEEIAEVTGLTHTNIRVKVHRIKERLFKKFKEHGKL
jgi:RNA polymerase sigma-70 factor (ECF subfamily)